MVIIIKILIMRIKISSAAIYYCFIIKIKILQSAEIMTVMWKKCQWIENKLTKFP